MAKGITSETLAFRPRARLLQMLGDQLIGSPRLAIFELVKNGYDADATTVTITLDKINESDAEIIVEDNGKGMTIDVIKNIWLVPAHDHKEIQKKENIRTEFGRLPLGEKGLGRFAVHKLGNEIELITKSKGHPECVVHIYWDELIDKPFLADTQVTVNTREPLVFAEGTQGTKVIIRQLRENNWTRGEVRRLLRQITSISSPFPMGRNDKFETILAVTNHDEWISGVPDVEILKNRAPWHVKFEFKDGKIELNYTFRGIPGIAAERRTLTKSNEPLLIYPLKKDDDNEKKNKYVASLDQSRGIGNVSGEFYIFDRDKVVLSKLGDQKLIESFLDDNGGIRVYRDNMRVYNYGEPGDDWLGLDLRRVNIPGRNVSRNIIIGSIDLQLESSKDLQEKTNREGFVENDTYTRFKEIVLGALSMVEFERKIDKDRIRQITDAPHDKEVKYIEKPLDEVRKIAKKHNISSEIDPLLAKAEKNYNEMKDIMLNSGFSNMGIAIVFHEVEHGVRSLYNLIENTDDLNAIKSRASELLSVLDTFSDLLRSGENKKNSLKKLIKRARDINSIRLRKHNIRFVCPFLEEDKIDIEHAFNFRILIGILNNILDNSLYWLQVRWPNHSEESQRKIYIDVQLNLQGKLTIIIADNGSGFQDEKDQLVKPFFSRRPNGMGIGLYYVNLAMELNKGRLVVLGNKSDDVPEEFDGAALALVFD